MILPFRFFALSILKLLRRGSDEVKRDPCLPELASRQACLFARQVGKRSFFPPSALCTTTLFFCLTFLQTACTGKQPAGNAVAILQEVIAAEEAWNEERDSLSKTGWPDYSDTTLAEELLMRKEWQALLAGIDPASLPPADRINYDLFTLVLSDDIYNLEYRSHLMPLNSEGGFVTGILYALQGTRLNGQEEEEKYVRKLQALPAYIDQQIDNLQQGLQEGKTVPRIIVEKSLPIIQNNMTGSVEESLFLRPFGDRKTGDAYPACTQLVNEAILPAYQRLYDYLQVEYIPQTRESIGASELTDGKAYYEQRIRFFTTLDITPDEVFATGQEEVKRIRGEMEAIIRQLNFRGNFAEFLAFLRTDPQFYAKTGEQLLHHAAWLSKRAEAILPRYFNKLPRMPFTVEPVPAAIAPNYTGGRYSEGSYQGHKPGAYWVNTYRLENRPLYVLPSLTLHEAVPGHHTQIMLSQELEETPAFRNRTYLSAFGEGWALYAEYLGKEAGMYTTPYEDFGRLTYEMWRACRLVVDVGMHYKGWSRQQAVDFMAENTALSFHEVNTEIDRYIGWPGQAVSYKMGELTIRRLRKESETALGKDFDLRAFHDLVLANGSLPMQSLERIVKEHFRK